MPGVGRTPKNPDSRRRRAAPGRGEWKPTPGIGWQHGPPPEPPESLGNAARTAWATWMGAWFAAHWTPDDLPGLRRVAQLYDLCEQFFEDPYVAKEVGDAIVHVLRPNPAAELRQLMDNYGITPKGQQDRRWVRPEGADSASTRPPGRSSKGSSASPYDGLRLVSSK
ncbi:MAG TPA: hypothetical protein VM305_08450 [Candidatus Limnocylindrales bacterium]|nr:hypothetical protein [Candidatus Limnocylindrales bacterium]